MMKQIRHAFALLLLAMPVVLVGCGDDEKKVPDGGKPDGALVSDGAGTVQSDTPIAQPDAPAVEAARGPDVALIPDTPVTIDTAPAVDVVTPVDATSPVDGGAIDAPASPEVKPAVDGGAGVDSGAPVDGGAGIDGPRAA